jgi:hypothetical protein
MSKIITVTDIIVKDFTADYVNQRIIVHYAITDGAREWFQDLTAIFWAVLPSSPGTNDYLLPTTYVTMFTNLYSAAHDAIKSREGI